MSTSRPTTYFDGATIRHLEVPASASGNGPRIGSFSYAPDGSVWTVVIDMRTPEERGCEIKPKQCQGVPDGLYVITPEAVATTEWQPLRLLAIRSAAPCCIALVRRE